MALKLHSEPYPPYDLGTTSPQTIATELARRSQYFITVYNKRDFDLQSYEARELIDHLSLDWEAQFDHHLHPISFDEQLQEWRHMAKEDPGMFLEVREIHAEVQMKLGIASVYMQVRATNVQRLQMQATCEFKWEFVTEKWMCYYYVAFRGLDMD